MHLQRWLLALTLLLPPAGCGLGSIAPDDDPDPAPGATTRILFVGNSLTYVNDLPGMVKALADSAGILGVQTAQVAKPDYALEDHWNDGQASRVIGKGGWTYVVMQQGPSAVLANRANLRQWVATFAELIRTKGGTPALYQIWPQQVNFSDFDASSESYRLAARGRERDLSAGRERLARGVGPGSVAGLLCGRRTARLGGGNLPRRAHGIRRTLPPFGRRNASRTDGPGGLLPDPGRAGRCCSSRPPTR